MLEIKVKEEDVLYSEEHDAIQQTSSRRCVREVWKQRSREGDNQKRRERVLNDGAQGSGEGAGEGL